MYGLLELHRVLCAAHLAIVVDLVLFTQQHEDWRVPYILSVSEGVPARPGRIQKGAFDVVSLLSPFCLLRVSIGRGGDTVGDREGDREGD